MKRIIWGVVIVCVALTMAVVSCRSRTEAELGTKGEPVVISFLPVGKDKAAQEKDAKVIGDLIAKASGLDVKVVFAKDYISMIDGLASKTIDVAEMGPLIYLLAHEMKSADAIFQWKQRDGKSSYESAIIVHTGSAIKGIEDLAGRSVAFRDPFSLSGYLAPLYMMNEKGVKPGETVFVKDPKEVVDMVYNEKVDAGAIFYAPHDPDGRINDARRLVVDKYPDVIDKVEILALSLPLPSGVVAFRSSLSEDVKAKLVTAFEKVGNSPEMIASLSNMYDVVGLNPANDANFNGVRDMLKKLGKDIKETIPGAVDYYRKNFWDQAPSPY